VLSFTVASHTHGAELSVHHDIAFASLSLHHITLHLKYIDKQRIKAHVVVIATYESVAPPRTNECQNHWRQAEAVRRCGNLAQALSELSGAGRGSAGSHLRLWGGELEVFWSTALIIGMLSEPSFRNFGWRGEGDRGRIGGRLRVRVSTSRQGLVG